MTKRLFGLLLFVSRCAAVGPPEPLADGVAIPVGFAIYGTANDGCLLRSERLDPSTAVGLNSPLASPYQSGHPLLVALLVDLARAYITQFSDHPRYPIRLGDLSREGGGVLLPHQSHQVGLDVDLYFFDRAPDHRAWPLDYVRTQNGVSEAFDLERNAWLLGQIASRPEVERMFVAAEVKQTLCAEQGRRFGDRELNVGVLRLIRPWYGHRDHVHVRLKCPKGEAYCFSGAEPIPEGDGCEEVAAWLGDPAHHERRLRLDLSRKGKFNRRCFPRVAGFISDPIARERVEAFEKGEVLGPSGDSR